MNSARRLLSCVVAVLGFVCVAASAHGQAIRGVVVDQTGLPLPGATVQLLDGKAVVDTWITEADGSFAIGVTLKGSTVEVSLSGFETTRVERVDATRIILAIGRASTTTEVIADAVEQVSPTAPLIGRALPATLLSRVPPAHWRTTEALPLLPSVVRGPDGLLVGGARAHETPLFIDGFDVSDPATGASSISLPFETTRNIEVMRDPTAITYGGLIGSLVQLDTRTGADKRMIGVQGFVPRPRFTNPGFGRLEGIFPRTYWGDQTANGRLRHFVAAEYNYERIPVPGVTQGKGPDIVEESGSVFARVDFQATPRTEITVESFIFPSNTDRSGLSPRRETAATAVVHGKDSFAGVTSRHVFGARSVLSLRVGVLSHDGRLTPDSSGPATLSPAGWRDNWFATVRRNAVRYTVSALWERSLGSGLHSHDLSVQTSLNVRRMNGSVSESDVVVEDALGRAVRGVSFGRDASLASHDRPASVSVRDVWRTSPHLQFDGGIRVDHDSHYGGATPSMRGGVRWALGEENATVLKLGAGRFVGNVPLIAAAFGGYPTRIDRDLDPLTGRPTAERFFAPTVGTLEMPRAKAFTGQLEHRVRPGFDTQFGVTVRRSDRIATLDVSSTGGPLTVASTGRNTYREFQFSARKLLPADQQVFVSYVNASAKGELNDFSALFQGFDAPLLQPGGRARLATDARHRWLTWGTFNAPLKFVVSPVFEVRSGFRYSALTDRQTYAAAPNGEAYPVFMSLDLIISRPIERFGHAADFGIQLFNATNHQNPRDVYPVVGAPGYGTFTNSVGTILRGFMLIKW